MQITKQQLEQLKQMTIKEAAAFLKVNAATAANFAKKNGFKFKLGNVGRPSKIKVVDT